MRSYPPKTLFDAIEWSSSNLATIKFLPTGDRRKNGVALTFRHVNGETETVGGYSVLHCVQKALIKIDVKTA